MKILRISVVLCLCGPVMAFLVVSSSASHDRITSSVVDARIEVFKADRVLLLYSGERLLRRHPVGLGFDPITPKRRQGDGATPEGEYRVCVKNPQSRFLLSLGLDYPNAADADRGRSSGLISASEHAAIVDAHEHGRRPPWNTRLGGEIYIHGRGSGSDWTLGCIALDDPAMTELFVAVGVGTPVVIHP